MVNSNKFSYAPSIENEESDASMAQNTKEVELKLVKISLTIGGVKGDYAFDKKTDTVYDYNSYIAAREMGGEPLMVGKILEKEGKKSFVKMSSASVGASAVAEAKPKVKSSVVAESKEDGGKAAPPSKEVSKVSSSKDKPPTSK